jgi:hypothetical protein
MIVDVKVFDVGIQKALNINTFSCDWFGKSIIGIKKNKKTKKQTKKKQKNNKQTFNESKKQKPHPKKAPPQVWWSFKTFGIWWEYFFNLVVYFNKTIILFKFRVKYI